MNGAKNVQAYHHSKTHCPKNKKQKRFPNFENRWIISNKTKQNKTKQKIHSRSNQNKTKQNKNSFTFKSKQTKRNKSPSNQNKTKQKFIHLQIKIGDVCQNITNQTIQKQQKTKAKQIK